MRSLFKIGKKSITQTGMSTEKNNMNIVWKVNKVLPLIDLKVFKLSVLILFQNINNCNQ